MFQKSFRVLNLLGVLFAAILLVGCVPSATPTPAAQIANPASQNCIDQGGTLQIQERGDGGQYGICYFEDNRQCEEWALYRGDCPVGGLKVTGLITPAAQYCVITGGTYAVTGNPNTDNEQGTCTFKNGNVCDAWDYYNGKCAAETGSPASGAGQIVFSSDRGDGYSGIYVLSRDGSAAASLVLGDSNYFAGPWSPDGQKILFTGFGPTHSYVGVMNADGSGQTDLSQQPDSDEAFPAWSPDGSQIAFTSRRDGNNEIYVMNADGSSQTRLTAEPGDQFAPTWSPDGSQIAFASDRENKPGVYSIWIMSADGSNATRLTNSEGSDDWPSWSPDGEKIAFRSFHDNTADIFLIAADGSGLLQLTDGQGENWSPSWSPDGAQLVFQTNRDSNWEIYLMNADGSSPVNLTGDPADDQYPHMQP